MSAVAIKADEQKTNLFYQVVALELIDLLSSLQPNNNINYFEFNPSPQCTTLYSAYRMGLKIQDKYIQLFSQSVFKSVINNFMNDTSSVYSTWSLIQQYALNFKKGLTIRCASSCERVIAQLGQEQGYGRVSICKNNMQSIYGLHLKTTLVNCALNFNKQMGQKVSSGDRFLPLVLPVLANKGIPYMLGYPSGSKGRQQALQGYTTLGFQGCCAEGLKSVDRYRSYSVVLGNLPPSLSYLLYERVRSSLYSLGKVTLNTNYVLNS